MSIELYKPKHIPSFDCDEYDGLPRKAIREYPKYQGVEVEDFFKTGGSIVDVPFVPGEDISPINSPRQDQGIKERYTKVFIRNDFGKDLSDPVIYCKRTTTKSFLGVSLIDNEGWYASRMRYRYGGEDYNRCLFVFASPNTFDDWERGNPLWVPSSVGRTPNVMIPNYTEGQPVLEYFDDGGNLDDFSPVIIEVEEDYTYLPPITLENYTSYSFDIHLVTYGGERFVLVTNLTSSYISSLGFLIVVTQKAVFGASGELLHFDYHGGGDSWREVPGYEYFINYYKWDVSDVSHNVQPMYDPDQEIILSSTPTVYPWGRFATNYLAWRVPSTGIAYERVVWLSEGGVETQVTANNTEVKGFRGDKPVRLFLVGGREFNGVADNACYYTELDAESLLIYLQGNGTIDHIAKNKTGKGTEIVFQGQGPHDNYLPLGVSVWQQIPSGGGGYYYSGGGSPVYPAFICKVIKKEVEVARSFLYFQSNSEFNGFYLEVGSFKNDDSIYKCGYCGYMFEKFEADIVEGIEVCPHIDPATGEKCGSSNLKEDTRFKISLEIYDNTINRWKKLRDVDSFGDEAEFWDDTMACKKSGYVLFSNKIKMQLTNLSKENPSEFHHIYFPNMFRTIYTRNTSQVGDNFYKNLYCVRFNISVKDGMKDREEVDYQSSIRSIVYSLLKDEYAPPGHEYSIAIGDTNDWYIQGDRPSNGDGTHLGWRAQTGRIRDGIILGRELKDGEIIPIWVKTLVKPNSPPRSNNLVKIFLGNRG